MKGRDVEGVKLRLVSRFTVRGRVILEARQGLPTPNAPQVLLFRQHNGQPIFGVDISLGRPGADGRFEIESGDPGIYRILGGPPPPFYYLDSIRLGETPVLGDVELGPGAPEVTVVYKSDGGTVRGSVEKCGAGRVMLIPQDPVNWPALSGPPAFSGACDGSGRFDITGIRPGSYYALALPDYQIVNPELAGPFLPSATRVTVRAGEVTQADLTLSVVR